MHVKSRCKSLRGTHWIRGTDTLIVDIAPTSGTGNEEQARPVGRPDRTDIEMCTVTDAGTGLPIGADDPDRARRQVRELISGVDKSRVSLDKRDTRVIRRPRDRVWIVRGQ